MVRESWVNRYKTPICALAHRLPGRSVVNAFLHLSLGKEGMIKLQINERLGDRSRLWLANTAKVNYSVVRNLAKHRSQQIAYSTLEKICAVLECEPGDLLVRVPGPGLVPRPTSRKKRRDG